MLNDFIDRLLKFGALSDKGIEEIQMNQYTFDLLLKETSHVDVFQVKTDPMMMRRPEPYIFGIHIDLNERMFTGEYLFLKKRG